MKQLIRIRWFWLAVLTLIGIAVGLLHSASSPRNELENDKHAFFQAPKKIIGREIPVRLQPNADEAVSSLIRDDDFNTIVELSIPTWHAVKATAALHALRLWGNREIRVENYRSPFGTPIYTGKALTELFLNQDSSCRNVPAWEPVLAWTHHGIAARLDPTFKSSYVGVLRHQDDLLAACAVAGLPISSPVVADGRDGTLQNLLDCSIATFSAENELEWSIVAYAHYLPPTTKWTNRFNQTFSFDDCAQSLLEQSEEGSACLATHVPYALCTLLRVNEQLPIISERTIHLCERRLKEISKAIERNQRPDGRWPLRWWSPEEKDRRTPAEMGDAFLTVTIAGHHLEWIALAPAHLRPSSSSISASTVSACRVARLLPRYEVSEIYAPFSHLARAVFLLSGESVTNALSDNTNPEAGESR
jgi:hypothetical protein